MTTIFSNLELVGIGLTVGSSYRRNLISSKLHDDPPSLPLPAASTTMMYVPGSTIAWVVMAFFPLSLQALSLEPHAQRHHAGDPTSLRNPMTTAHLSLSSAVSRREAFWTVVTTATASASAAAVVVVTPTSAVAVADCFQDCLTNCKKIAPADSAYCLDNCREYCERDDRKDGLSGSVSAEGGEVGILGGTFGQGTVPKGEDKPPSIRLPGLDFTSKDGKKLIGY